MADDKPGVGPVSDAMSSRGLAGKRDYVRSLERRRDDDALVRLVECLSDESGYLRELAEAALLKIGERSGPALLPLLGQGLWFSRSSAARVLGQMGHAAAAGPLLRLADDSVETVVRDAYGALVTLGRSGASARIAWELHRMQPEQRHERLARLVQTDRAMGERIQRLLGVETLMSQTDPDVLLDDSPLVRASEELPTWERLPDPPPVKPGSPADPATPTQGTDTATP